jgi:hypothetical protein
MRIGSWWSHLVGVGTLAFLALAPAACGDGGAPLYQDTEFTGQLQPEEAAEICAGICRHVATCEPQAESNQIACEAGCQLDLAEVTRAAAQEYSACVRMTVAAALAEDLSCDDWQAVCAPALVAPSM